MKLFSIFIAIQIILYNSNKVVGNETRSWPSNYEVCYGIEGCFSNSFPFNNSGNFLPVAPEILGTEFLLFTQNNLNNEDYLDYKDENSIKTSHFNPNLPLKILIHGFTHNKKTQWINTLKNEILKKNQVNVVLVGWGNGCKFPLYPNATANTRMVGKQIGLLVNIIRSIFFESNPKDLKIHCIGHSLGSHTCAYASNAAFIPFNRISALDPAGPSFENTPIEVRVDPTDADFVDVVHTNGASAGLLSGSYGMVSPVGHVDFYVNGGYMQPDCPTITNIGSLSLDLESLVACSHMRAVYLFIETVSSDCQLLAFSCTSQASFNKGECTSCENNKCAIMGYDSNDFINGGSMFLNTNPSSPYCGYHNLFEFEVSSQSKQATGDITLRINSDSSNILKPLVGEGISSGVTVKKLVQSKYDITSIDSFEMTFTKKVSLIFPGFYPDSFILNKVKLTSLKNNKIFSVCVPNTVMINDITKKFSIQEGDCNL